MTTPPNSAEPTLMLKMSHEDALVIGKILRDFTERLGHTVTGEEARRIAYFMFQMERFSERAKV